MDAGVSFFEELQGRKEEVNRMTIQISRHSATEKQNAEARITCGCLAFQPSNASACC